MTKGPWKLEKSLGDDDFTHFHVVMSDDEVLDVLTKEDALAIAQVPEFLKLLKYMINGSDYIDLEKALKLAEKIHKKIYKK
jgi:hypothetical protein